MHHRVLYLFVEFFVLCLNETFLGLGRFFYVFEGKNCFFVFFEVYSWSSLGEIVGLELDALWEFFVALGFIMSRTILFGVCVQWTDFVPEELWILDIKLCLGIYIFPACEFLEFWFHLYYHILSTLKQFSWYVQHKTKCQICPSFS